MAQVSFPFDNSVSTETDWSRIMRYIPASTGGGVAGYPGDTSVKVTADSSGMSVKVAPGFAIVRGHAYLNDATITLTINNASTNPRIDRVVLSLDPSSNSITAAVVSGTPAVSPVAPSLTQTDAAVYQLLLAEVYVGGSVSTISNSNVTDLRSFIGSNVGVWTTATRPASPATGFLGYNTSSSAFEYWNGTQWGPVTPTGFDASIINSGTLPVSRGGTGLSAMSAGFLKHNGSALTSGNGVLASDIADTEQANIAAGKIRSGGVSGGTPVTIYVQSATPTGATTGALWFF